MIASHKFHCILSELSKTMKLALRIICQFIILIIILNDIPLWSQELKLRAKLPEFIKESSGIESTENGRFWTFNDSGANPEIYQIDVHGKLLRTLMISNGWNRDWEDITKDKKGNLYIGNIGNNSNASKDLSIFKIPNPNDITSDSVSAAIISFYFEDQVSFPPSKKNMNFDCEAMFWFNQNIYLFTKHRSFPMATNLYKIPAKSGKHKAIKIDTFFTGKKSGKQDDFGKFWVTSAAISPNGKRICLINGSKLWLFYDFKKDHFFGGKHIKIDLGKRTQKEGVCFTTNNEIYITDEFWAGKNVGANLYSLKLKKALK